MSFSIFDEEEGDDGPQTGSGDTTGGLTSGGDDGGAELSLNSSLPSWVLDLRVLVLTGAVSTLVSFAEDPVDFIRAAVEQIIFESLLRPLASSVFNAGVALVDGTLVILFGTDRAIGIAPESTVGLIDLPFVITGPVTVIIVGFGDSVVGVIDGFNQGIAAGIEPLGLAAPTVVTGLWFAEVGIAAWGAWIMIQTLDIFTAGTIDSVIDVGMAIALPFRRLWGWFF